METKSDRVVIIGAGPAGLTAGYLLSKAGVPVVVLEADPVYVGGISKTVKYKDFYFDIGGHRFFSKSKEVEDLWAELLKDDMLDRPRSSRIHYGGKFYCYPLKAAEALFNLGIVQSSLCMLSYFKARVFPIKDPKNFEEWVTNQFGKRLFNIFFKTYTEKVWGMSCKEISADWAAQRIKGLSLASAIKNALLPKRQPKDKKDVIKSLIDQFRYPRRGPGMMWEAAAGKIRLFGGKVQMGHQVEGCEYDKNAGVWYVHARDAEGNPTVFEGEHVISSAAIGDMMPGLKPSLPDKVHEAVRSLRYRDFLTVSVILKDRNVFSDNWIYIHDSAVKVGRVQNFKSWSPEMVPDEELTCYGLEYFCFEGDGLWSSSDEDLIRLAKKELIHLKLAGEADFIDGCVVRQKKAYPVYDDDYADHVEAIRHAIAAEYPRFHMVGRNGMHKYNNQDHAMMTAMLTAENILAGEMKYDVWDVNQDAEYHESGDAGTESTSGLRGVPQRVGEEELVATHPEPRGEEQDVVGSETEEETTVHA